jgi:hypothetical protein
MYAVVVTQTVVRCASIVVDASSEEEAVERAIAQAEAKLPPLHDVATTYSGEVVKVIVAAGPPREDPAKRTTVMRVIRLDRSDTCPVHVSESPDFESTLVRCDRSLPCPIHDKDR